MRPCLMVKYQGYECLLLSDCTAATDYGNYMATLKTTQQAGGPEAQL